MKTKILEFNKEQGQRTLAVVFDKHDAFVKGLIEVARQQKLAGSHFTAIGAFRDVILGYFDRERMDYQKVPVQQQVEVLSLIGNITLNNDEPRVHAHVVVGRSDGTTLGGHILEAHVWPTLEVIIVELPGHLQRKTDAETGLALLDLEA